MSATTTTNVPLPTDLVEELNIQAKRAGLGLAPYVRLLVSVSGRRHDPDFVSAARYLFTKYPDTLRKLASDPRSS
jgi:hypothetical protein